LSFLAEIGISAQPQYVSQTQKGVAVLPFDPLAHYWITSTRSLENNQTNPNF
jgi:hypothetical protein